MIQNWELTDRLDQKTGAIHYYLLTDGTEQDVRLIARKLKGYVKDISAAQYPYTYTFELREDLDEITLDKIRTAVKEGVTLSSKVNEFVPGGSLGDPLFTAHTVREEKAFPTFLTLDPATDLLNKSGPATPSKRPQLDLDATHFPGNATELIQTHVSMDENPEHAVAREMRPEETMLSTAAREVFATQIHSPEPEEPLVIDIEESPAVDITAPPTSAATPRPPKAESTISISDQDMLLKDMEGSVLGKMPLEDILSADTRQDLFIDVKQNHANKPQPSTPEKQADSATASDAFNVFESDVADTDNLLDVAEIHTITDKITQKNMDFIKKPNTPEEKPQMPSVSQPQTDALPAAQPQAVPPAAPQSAPAAPARPDNPSFPNTPPQQPAHTVAPQAPVQREALPDITIRSPKKEELDNTFNLEESFAGAKQPPHKTILRVRRPTPNPAPEQPQQDPGKTVLRLRRKEVTPHAAQQPEGVAKPLRSTMSPERAAANLHLAQSKVIDHSIEIPISELKKHNWPLETPLVPTYTMNNMVMSVNRFAHATAISVIESPGKLYNPLVLHGSTGTGKTHFLNALAFAFSKKFGQEHIFMTNGVRLSRGIQRYVMEGNIANFEKFMESVQALLIDDIHLLAINEQNREYVSKLLNSFLRNQKQIVITSKYPPESLAKLEELIKFRLDAGWISELKPATGATHFRIVKKMLIESGVDLNDKQIEEFFGGNNMTLGTVTRSIRRLKVLENLLFQNLEQDAKSQAGIFEKLLATRGEDPSSELMTKDPAEIVNFTPSGNGEWGRIGIFYPQNCSDMMSWIVYALDQRAKELSINGGFDIVVRSSYSTENIISSAFKIANLCDNKKLKGAIILGPRPDACDPSVRENFYDILTHMLEIMLIRCGIINFEDVRLPSTYVKIISELMR